MTFYLASSVRVLARGMKRWERKESFIWMIEKRSGLLIVIQINVQNHKISVGKLFMELSFQPCPMPKSPLCCPKRVAIQPSPEHTGETRLLLLWEFLPVRSWHVPFWNYHLMILTLFPTATQGSQTSLTQRQVILLLDFSFKLNNHIPEDIPLQFIKIFFFS